ncbi:Endonuclease/exonuclease/phosphatase [Trema orientale]|uniref:Endonuclease/exonuclease/phosphatase n=1 Tax=Trema orientale TaxID=63057 RepID=A0A2P5BF59_TREOI|nr:Endonuclease/exonuclease/phosphatase [Trema orientale]
METYLWGRRANAIKHQIGFPHGIFVDSIGRSGGLALCWNEDVHASRRRHTWDLIRRLALMSTQPWCCLGDFNAILCHDEKLGGSKKSNLSMNRFHRVLENCGLSDLGFEGDMITWNNGRGDVANVQERLDRRVATLEWRSLFLGYKLSHLDLWGSDHRVILLDIYPSLGGTVCSSSRRGFRFEPAWLCDDKCIEVVARSWQSCNFSGLVKSFLSGLKKCGTNLIS